MAEGKKSFTAYCDWIETFESLKDEEAGKLAKHLFRYVNDLNPDAPDTLTKVAFAQIKMTLKRDLKKWEDKKNERSNAGILGNLKRYQKDLYDAVVSDTMTIEEAQNVAKGRIAIDSDSKDSHSNTKLAVSDSVSVSDSVDTKVSFLYEEKEFLIDWAKCRKHFLDKPTNITRLNAMERTLFNQAINNYTPEQIKDAMKGLFKQIKIDFTSMVTRPKHFLSKIDDYYQAELGKDYKLYGDKKQKVQL